MYESFFNLSALPFENTPDPRFFFASEQHREALAAIEYTIRMRKGFVLITGDIGAGKTTVGRTMCERCGDQVQIVPVLHGHDAGASVIRQILRAMNVRVHAKADHARLLEKLQDRLVEQMEIGRPIVLLVDEAQTLSDGALEELRLLSNFDTSRTKPVQVVMIGQPELRQRIRQPRFAALRQRIVLAKQLKSMTPYECGAYIQHRIRAASADPSHAQVEFTEPALAEIYRFTNGTPRIINVVCDNCLLLGYVRQTRQITPAMVRRVVQDMVPSFGDLGDQANDTEQAPLSLAGNF